MDEIAEYAGRKYNCGADIKWIIENETLCTIYRPASLPDDADDTDRDILKETDQPIL